MGIYDVFAEPLDFACANEFANDLIVTIVFQQNPASFFKLSILCDNHEFETRIGDASYSAFYKTHT